MQPPFTITTDPVRKLMTITFESVFWDAGVADLFVHRCLAAVDSLGCEPGEHLALVDLRGAVLQSQVIYEKMQMLVTHATSKRIALIAASPLARMQTKRLQTRDNVVMFADVSQAEAWLFGDHRQVA